MFLYIMLTTLSIHNSQEDPIQILNLYRYYIHNYITILSSEFSVKGNIELEME